MLDHIGFPVADFKRSKAFYTQALAPLGYKLVMQVSLSEDGEDGYAGFGDDRPHFWIGTGKPLQSRLHVAFAAKTRAEVRAFYEAAHCRRRHRQRAPGPAPALPRELLWGLRARPRRAQHRGREPPSRVKAARPIRRYSGPKKRKTGGAIRGHRS